MGDSHGNGPSSSLTISSKRLLSSGYSIPLLGLGVYQNYTTKESVEEALRFGYRHIDTAQAYKSEAHVGEGVKASGIPREDVFITTKIISKFHGYNSTLAGVEASLKRMDTDYIDLFLIHDPFAGAAKRLETYKALLEARDRGWVRSVGVSNYNIAHLEEIRAAGLEMPSVNQIELHPFNQHPELVNYCQDNNIAIQAYSPLVRGELGHPVFAELGKKYGKEPAQIVLRWSLQRGFIPLPKSALPSRIKSNAALYDFELSEEDVAKLNALDEGNAVGARTWSRDALNAP